MIIKQSIRNLQNKTYYACKIKNAKYLEALRIAKVAHLSLGCRGTRTDLKFFQNKFYILETNTQPGMTSLSQFRNSELLRNSFQNLVEKILLDASINR